MSSCKLPFFISLVLTVLAISGFDPLQASERVQSGLQLLYDFNSDDGNTVRDRSGQEDPVDLVIANMDAVELRDGALIIKGSTQIRSRGAVSRLAEAVRQSGELTIEAWVQPSTLDQDGPARIVTFSTSPSQRNFTLGQDGNRYDIRLRTTQTGVNGVPSLSLDEGTATTELTHVVYSRDRTGITRVYLNGKQVKEETIEGSTSGWEHFRFALGNEIGGDRPWKGTLHLVAVYSRDLLPAEVIMNFEAGPDYRVDPAVLARRDRSHGAELFNRGVAPLLAEHCLECHDSATREGDLDLSRKDAALAGSSSGTVIEPGNAAESYIIESVESGDMPKDRTPLSRQEIALLAEWINAGAVWTMDPIDPVVFAHESKNTENWIRRLTVDEYIATVRDAVGVDIAEEAREILPKDLRADGFSNTAYNLNVDLGHVNAYAQLAEIITGKMDPLEFAKQFSNNLRFTDNDMGRLIERMGKWLLRGPLEENEVIAYRGITTTIAGSGGTMEEAVRYLLEAMLQSPRFIYRVENQQGDGTAWPVGPYELASRLSYTIWGAPPDRKLMKAAEDGELFTREEVRAQAERMLEDPRARERSARFAHEWLNLGRLDNLRPNSEKFPKWEAKLAADMREETLAFFEDLVWEQNRPLSDLFNAQFTYLTSDLARHYGLKPKAEQGTGLAKYDMAGEPSRGGLLTQGSILTVGGDEASMVTRGLFVLHDILRGTVKDPPPGLDTTPVPSSPGQSQRDIAEDRIANKSCGGCHSKFEPLAFGLEKYDGLGTFHEKDEYGNELRSDGKILVPGTAEPVEYQTSSELMDLLASSPRVQETVTWKLAQFALGRPLVAEDVPILDAIHEQAREAGFTYQDLMVAIVTSDLIRKTRTEGQGDAGDPTLVSLLEHSQTSDTVNEKENRP